MWQGIRPKGLPSQRAVTPEQRTQIEASLNGLTGVVENVFYESQQDAYNRFKEQFKNSPILENVTPESMPESFRVKLANPEDFAKVAAAVGTSPGVEQVQDQRKLLEKFFKLLAACRQLPSELPSRCCW